MLKILQLILLFSFILYGQDLKEKTEEILKSYFPSPVTLQMIKYHLPSDIKDKVEKAAGQRFFGEDIYIYKIFQGKELTAVSILDNVYGKAMPITFLVLFDLEGKIKSAEVIKYREQYGGAVQNKRWSDQFKGKDSGSGYKVGKDVNSISGATISVNSVTKGIRKAALLFMEIKGII
jgi:Na+-translocating ferredoxin:NAD+ oxidoreductase RnfG subunit